MQKTVKTFTFNSKTYSRYGHYSIIVSKIYLMYTKYVNQFSCSTTASIILDILHYHNIVAEKSLPHIIDRMEYSLVKTIFNLYTKEYNSINKSNTCSQNTLYVKNKGINKVILYSEKDVIREDNKIIIKKHNFQITLANDNLTLIYNDKTSHYVGGFSKSKSTHTLKELFELYNLCKKEILVENNIICR